MAVYLGTQQVKMTGGFGGLSAQTQTKSVDPTTTSVSVKPDDGYTLSEVIVNPIPTNFIGSGITKKSAQEYTPGNSSITINAGQYLSGAQTIKAVPTVTGSATSNGTYTPVSGKYFSQFTVNVPPSGVTLPLMSNEAEAEHLLSGGQLISSNNTIVTGTMPNIGAATGTISTKTGTYTIAKGYHSGTGSVSISSTEQAKIIADNIKSGVTILGVTGTYVGNTGYTSGDVVKAVSTSVNFGSGYGSIRVTYGTSVVNTNGTLSLGNSTTISVSSAGDLDVVKGNYVLISSTIYYIPTDASISYTGNSFNKTYTSDKASPVFVIA